MSFVVVRIDVEAVRSAVDPAVLQTADELLNAGRVGGITAVGGGAICLVKSGDGRPGHEVWVGVTAAGFTGECDCGGCGTDELCVHAVAVTLAALRQGFAWSANATPPAESEVDPRVRQLAAIAATLPPRRLAMLVAEHAMVDPRLETRLMMYADGLGPLGDAELADVRETIASLASEALRGEWDLPHVVRTGHWIVEELDLLAQRPVSEAAVLLVEYAARRWDELASHLYAAAGVYESETEEISDALRAIHVRMCRELQADPDELTERLIAVIGEAKAASCLDQPGDYLTLLGPERLASLPGQ